MAVLLSSHECKPRVANQRSPMVSDHEEIGQFDDDEIHALKIAAPIKMHK